MKYIKLENNKKQYFVKKELDGIQFSCLIFDIDGVLIDVTKSYNEAIKKTVDFIINKINEKYRWKNIVTNKLILKFRKSGGFNNDIDTSYAILITLLSLPYDTNTTATKKFLYKVAENADERGIRSVEEFLSKQNIDLQRFKEMLNYPNTYNDKKDSIVSRIFNEFFYGSQLFKKRYGYKTKYYFDKPLIDNDKIIIQEKICRMLYNMFQKNIGIVSGRSKIAATYSLNKKINIFNEKACIFLEDKNRKYAKPNTYGIKKSINNIINKQKKDEKDIKINVMYCGDAVEDLLMVNMFNEECNSRKNKNLSKINAYFCGIYENSPDPNELIEKFIEKNADIIIKSVNDLPYILNKVYSNNKID